MASFSLLKRIARLASMFVLGAGSAAAQVVAPGVALYLSPAVITAGGAYTSTMTVQIVDSSGLGIAAGAIASFPYGTGIVNAANPVVDNTCGGALSALPGAGALSIAGVVLDPLNSCVIQIAVTAPAPGTFTATFAAGAFVGSTGPNTVAAQVTLTALPPVVVVNTGDSGPGSLRDAIFFTNANCATGPYTITFAIPGTGPFVISPLTELPDITCGVTIDGYTQPGSSRNTDTGFSNNANILVAIDGRSCSGCITGPKISGGLETTLSGLAIFGFTDVNVHTITPVKLLGNYIGTDPGGMNGFGTHWGVIASSEYLTAGGTAPGDRNVITGNLVGIHVASRGMIAGNQIGGRRDGSAGVGNDIGVHLVGSNGHTEVLRNAIRHNSGSGVVVNPTVSGHVIVRSNSISDNGGIGIDLNEDGPTANDETGPPYDGDAGPNRLMNYPVITGVHHVGADTLVNGYIKTEDDADATIELFHNSAAPSAITQGEKPIHSFSVITDADGLATFSVTIPGFLAENVSAASWTDWCRDGCDYSSEFSPSVAVTALSASPAIVFAPSSLSFAARALNTTSLAQRVTLTNNGPGALAIASIVASGDYAFTSDCGTTLAFAASCALDVTFTPLAAGTRTGALTVTSNASGAPRAVALTGVGQSDAAAVIELSVTALEFAPQTVGTRSAPQAVVVANSGNALLTFDTFSVSGEFVLQPDVATTTYQRCGGALAPGAVCALEIAFAPALQGLREGLLSIVSNAGATPARLRLLGTGIVTETPRTLSVVQEIRFGDQPVGSSSEARPLAITNNAASVASLTELSASGDFSVSETCTTVEAGATCTPLVTFLPTALGERRGALTIRTLAESLPYVVSLSGLGTFNLVPQITLSVARLGFGNTLMGVPSTSRILVTNVGLIAATLHGAFASGDFLVGDSCGLSLAVGAVCAIDVSFFPRRVGLQEATFELASNAAGGPHAVQLSGIGCAFPTITRARVGQPVCGP
jgi:hypothetical protein